jgi:hypothetical protein
MADNTDPKKTPDAGTQEPQPDATPVTPSTEASPPSAEEVTTYLKDRGVDLSNPDVHQDLLNGMDADALIKKHGQEADPNKGAPDNVQAAEPISGQEDPNAQPDDPEPDAPEPKGEGKVRFTPKTEEDRAILAISRSKNISLLEAAKIYNGTGAESSPTPAEPTPDPQIEQFETQITEKTDAVKDLENRIKAAREDADYDTAMDLQNELFDVKSDLRDLTRERQVYEQNTKATAEAEYNRGVAASSKRVSEEYPALGKKNSIHRRAFDAFIAEHDGADPIFNNPDWPVVLAERFAEEYPEVRQSSAQSGKDGQPGTPQKQAQPTQQPARAGQQSRAAMLDGGQGGPESPAPTDESTKPPSMDQATAMYEQVTSKMTPAEQAAFDAEIYKNMQQTAAKV